MVEADNAAKAVEKARPNREEAARLIRYYSSLHASSPLTAKYIYSIPRVPQCLSLLGIGTVPPPVTQGSVRYPSPLNKRGGGTIACG
jgi:hypothetical protein